MNHDLHKFEKIQGNNGSGEIGVLQSIENLNSFCLTYPKHNLPWNAFLKINPHDSAHVAQSVERVLGKDEVGGSNPLVGST